MPILYNSAIKAPNEEHEYTKEEILELQKCSRNLIYFLKYVKIITRTGKSTFKPYQFQLDLLNLFDGHKHIICKVGRQSGKTIFVCAYLLHYSLFNKDKFVGIVSHKEASAKKILRDIKKMYEELPNWLKPGVVEWNKTSIEFDNGCRIEVSSTNANAFTGNTINILFCLTGRNEVTVRDKETGEIKNITLKELSEELSKLKKNINNGIIKQ